MNLTAEALEERLAECETVAFEWQEQLSEPCTEQTLVEAAKYLQPRHYQEILEERDANSYCGYPACDQSPKAAGSKYKIDFNRQIVYDQSSLRAFCSKRCQAASRFYALQLSTQPIHLRDPDSMPAIELIPLQGDISIDKLTNAAINKVTDPPVICNLATVNIDISESVDVASSSSNTTNTMSSQNIASSSSSQGIASSHHVAQLLNKQQAAALEQNKLPMKLMVHERFDENSNDTTAIKARPPSPSRAYTWNSVEGVKLRVPLSKQTKEADEDDEDEDDEDDMQDKQRDLDLDLSTLRISSTSSSRYT